MDFFTNMPVSMLLDLTRQHQSDLRDQFDHARSTSRHGPARWPAPVVRGLGRVRGVLARAEHWRRSSTAG
jgi:hypothetical protein